MTSVCHDLLLSADKLRHGDVVRQEGKLLCLHRHRDHHHLLRQESRGGLVQGLCLSVCLSVWLTVVFVIVHVQSLSALIFRCWLFSAKGPLTKDPCDTRIISFKWETVSIFGVPDIMEVNALVGISRHAFKVINRLPFQSLSLHSFCH